MKFSILTFGCKVNQCESEDIKMQMVKNGFVSCDDYKVSDVIIFNSCAVTAESVRKLRQSVRKVKKVNPKSIVLLTGCVAQTDLEEIKNCDEFDIIVGNDKKNEISNILVEYLHSNGNKVILVDSIFKSSKFENYSVNYLPHRSRAFLKIEDGCNRFCSYCIIPYARGKVRSKNLADIEKDVKELAKNGYKEIVLVGINLSSYGSDTGKNIADAVELVCRQSGIERVRLGSLEPDLLTDDILKRLKEEKKLCRHFHLVLQSGSDKILKSMRRKYTKREYLETANKIRNTFIDSTITTDLIVGFPGETEEDFNESLDVIEKVKFLKVHTFPYSSRPGTLAFNFAGKIDNETKSRRVKEVLEKSRESCRIVLNSFIGKERKVLYESIDAVGFYSGYTEEYIPVKTISNEDLQGKIVCTKLDSAMKEHILGTIKS